MQEVQQVCWVNHRWSGAKRCAPEWHNCQLHSRPELSMVTGNWTLNSFCWMFDSWYNNWSATILKQVAWIKNGHLVTAHLSDPGGFSTDQPDWLPQSKLYFVYVSDDDRCLLTLLKMSPPGQCREFLRTLQFWERMWYQSQTHTNFWVFRVTSIWREFKNIM